MNIPQNFIRGDARLTQRVIGVLVSQAALRNRNTMNALCNNTLKRHRAVSQMVRYRTTTTGAELNLNMCYLSLLSTKQKWISRRVYVHNKMLTRSPTRPPRDYLVSSRPTLLAACSFVQRKYLPTKLNQLCHTDGRHPVCSTA